MDMEEKGRFIEESGAVLIGHFVFKSRKHHGNLYIDKEKFPEIGARKLVRLIQAVGKDALESGLYFGSVKEIGIIGPAYGATPFVLPLAAYFEEQRPDIHFFPARTEQAFDEEGRSYHVLPDKLRSRYQNGVFIILEDIVNDGTTIRETEELFRTRANARIIAALCFADRGPQTAESLNVEQYYPYFARKMERHDIREGSCPQCQAGEPITLQPGKGKEWVAMFGQPPYPEDKDFSSFWEGQSF